MSDQEKDAIQEEIQEEVQEKKATELEEKKDEQKDNYSNRSRNKSRKSRSRSRTQNKSIEEDAKKLVEDTGDADKEVDLGQYISNVEGDIYAISGLPEEFIATLFAWVSRSSKSFKEHLHTALKDHDVRGGIEQFKKLDDKAKAFHEKWTVGYGHSSVAEHAFAHVGIEKVSRLASAELELANPFLSITEYSQRYQKPERGGWYNPFGNSKSENAKKYDAFLNKCFDVFEELIDGVYKHLWLQETLSDAYKNNHTDEKWVNRRKSAIEKLAFEDARYVLPLAMHTQLGMTANGRAWRDALSQVRTSKHLEVNSMADSIQEEVSKVLPVLLKYTDASAYKTLANAKMEHHFNKNQHNDLDYRVRLQSVVPEGTLIDEIIAALQVKHEGASMSAAINKARLMDTQKKEEIVLDLLDEMKFFDAPHDALKHVQYKAEFLVSEANWHQLLRHNRKTDFTWSNPTPYLGFTVPPRIKDAGLEELVVKLVEESEMLYKELEESEVSFVKEYVVLNAHNRRVYATFSLWEAYHLINLRTSDEAQWDIRETFEDLLYQIEKVHPTLISKAQRR